MGREEWEWEGSKWVDGRDKAQEGWKGWEQQTGGFTVAIQNSNPPKARGSNGG